MLFGIPGLKRRRPSWPTLTAWRRPRTCSHLLGRRESPFLRFPQGPGLERLEGRFPDLALKAAEQLIRADSGVYKPLYLHSPDPERAFGILSAVGRSFLALHPEGTVAVVSVPEYTEEFIRTISEGVSGAWRERWWSVDLLLLHGVQELPETEWAQDEFFHLFEALSQRGARIVLAADGPPSQIGGLRDRLASRLEGGIVVELGSEPFYERECQERAPPRLDAKPCWAWHSAPWLD